MSIYSGPLLCPLLIQFFLRKSCMCHVIFIIMYTEFFVLIGNGIFKDYFYFTIDNVKENN